MHVSIFQMECTSPNSTQRFFHTEVQICFRWVVDFQRQSACGVLLGCLAWLHACISQALLASAGDSGVLHCLCGSPGETARLQDACQWCCRSLLSNQSLASPWDCEGWCLLVPSGCSEQSCAIILSSAAGLAFCRPTHSHSVLPAARQNVIYNGLEFRNLLQLKNVFFFVVCKSLLVCACRCCHVNILQLLGFSVESDLHCLIYPYLPNGSLQNQLQCQVSNNMGLLSVCCYKSCPVTVWKAIKSLSLLRTSQNVPREVACEYEKALF